jgi:hypothetical protein
MRLSVHSFESITTPSSPNGTAPAPQHRCQNLEPVPRSLGHPATATGITWAAMPQCPACCPRAGSFLARLEQSPRPPIKFTQDLPLQIGGFEGGRSESQKLFSLGLPNRPRHFSIHCLARIAQPTLVSACLGSPGIRYLQHPGRPCSKGGWTWPSAGFTRPGPRRP